MSAGAATAKRLFLSLIALLHLLAFGSVALLVGGAMFGTRPLLAAGIFLALGMPLAVSVRQVVRNAVRPLDFVLGFALLLPLLVFFGPLPYFAVYAFTGLAMLLVWAVSKQSIKKDSEV